MPPDQLEMSWEGWGHLETPVTSLLGVLLRGKDSAGLSTREAHSFKSIYSGKVWAVRQQVRLLLQRHSQHCTPGYIPGLPFKREGISSSKPPISVRQLKPHKQKDKQPCLGKWLCSVWMCTGTRPAQILELSRRKRTALTFPLCKIIWNWWSVNFWGMKIL